MPSKIVRQPEQLGALVTILSGRKLPLTVSWVQGAPRSTAQNRLVQRWFSDIAAQLGDQTHDEVRAECKLIYGVPILRRGNEAFAASFDACFDGMDYAAQLAAVRAFDLPVTRLMTAPQMTEFMETVQREYSRLGVRLTDPDALKYEEEFA